MPWCVPWEFCGVALADIMSKDNRHTRYIMERIVLPCICMQVYQVVSLRYYSFVGVNGEQQAHTVTHILVYTLAYTDTCTHKHKHTLAYTRK